MYQFYYSGNKYEEKPDFKENIHNKFKIDGVRPTMWEEHCLECSAPLCFSTCNNYEKRSDGRCKRFSDGILTFDCPDACCGQGAHIKFRKWANMMTIIFPAMMSEKEYSSLWKKNQKLGGILKKIIDSKLPLKIRWETVRTIEYIRRRILRELKCNDNVPDAFIFHGYSYNEEPYNLIIEIYDDRTPLFKTSLNIKHGENIFEINKNSLSDECSKPGNLVKVYPENNIEAELDILWCDFVKGSPIVSEKPADKVKCVVWDLDNTLWDGILIESDTPDELKLRDGVADLIKQLDERGIIQSIASKNDYDNACSVIEKLGLKEYFIYPQIHWNAKSGSMKQIAESLNIGIDSLALIDDSEFERNQVKTACPQVRTYDADEISTLIENDEFQVVVTEDSKKRRLMYKAEEKRNALKNSGNSDTVEFLKRCNFTMRIFNPESDNDILRCYELVNRTNQLNMSGRRYTIEEFSDVLKRENHKNFAFSCHDDFGEYGIVGFGQYTVKNNKIIFTEFAMSCRVAGKYVESALFAHLLKKEKCESGLFKITKTKKNSFLRKTLDRIGFTPNSENDSQVQYVFTNNLLNKNIIKIK